MRISQEDWKKIAYLSSEGWSIERISEDLMIPMFWISDIVEWSENVQPIIDKLPSYQRQSGFENKFLQK